MNNDFCIEEEYEECLQEIKRLNNDIKILLKENEIKEKVISKYEELTNKAIEYINQYLPNYDFDKTNLKELKDILGSDKE